MRPPHYVRLHSYDTEAWPFQEVAQRVLECDDLARLHAQHGVRQLVTRETDQLSTMHMAWYAGQHLEFAPLYERFVRAVIAPLWSQEIIVQAVPTFRVSTPRNMAVGSFHRDTEFGHVEDEVNYWLPFTDARGSNSIWLYRDHMGDIHPVGVQYGSMLEFDGASTIHGNVPNFTGATRVSVDFRIIPKAQYKDRDRITVHAGRTFRLGDYWREL